MRYNKCLCVNFNVTSNTSFYTDIIQYFLPILLNKLSLMYQTHSFKYFFLNHEKVFYNLDFVGLLVIGRNFRFYIWKNGKGEMLRKGDDSSFAVYLYNFLVISSLSDDSYKHVPPSLLFPHSRWPGRLTDQSSCNVI